MRRNSRHTAHDGRHSEATMQEERPQEGDRREAARQKASEHSEGSVARAIEQQTAKLPSDVFLWTACACMGSSWLLQLMGHKHAGLFVGQWVAPILLFGVYNKMVKINDEVMAKHP